MYARVQKVLSEGVHLLRVFLVYGGEWIQIPLTVGHHRPFRMRADDYWLDSFVTFQGIRTSIA